MLLEGVWGGGESARTLRASCHLVQQQVMDQLCDRLENLRHDQLDVEFMNDLPPLQHQAARS
jgi:hypothetical protein